MFYDETRTFVELNYTWTRVHRIRITAHNFCSGDYNDRC